ncbi:MAG: C4-dicarboxylic acid transporter DauA [Candidatus Sumerlaeia bacterium]|nr:C4-dicarboxylic acid transporter DauA [Candidatus Sumerlaeia bacterium]
MLGKNALYRTMKAGYGRGHFLADLGAGLTVGIVALPLSMALAIASGVPPQYGIYTAIVAGVLVALLGGAPLSVTGPTAAFVVLLFPIAARFGLGGLLVATVMAGFFQLVMGAAKLGRLISFIPHPVTTGFTAGIALTIAVLQLKDFFGMTLAHSPDHMLDKLAALSEAIHTFHWQDAAIGVFTLLVLVICPRLERRIPAPLVAVALAAAVAYGLHRVWPTFDVATIGTRFEYTLDGVVGRGVPPRLPHFEWPWNAPGPDGKPLGFSYALLTALAPSALAIAALGAIESLLCAVVANGMKGLPYDPDAELMAHGVGNMVVPFFGGFAATAAIARTAAGIRAGAHSPIAAIVHGLFLLAALPLLTPLLAYLPMAALAALLLLVAWNMSDLKHFAHIVAVAPRSDTLVLVSCFGLTFFFDMVVAVGAGVVLASLLFMRRMAEIADGHVIDAQAAFPEIEPPAGVHVYNIAGPLCFGAAEKALSSSAHLHLHGEARTVIINMAAVPAMDVTGLVALETVCDRLRRRHVRIILASVSRQPRALIERTLARHPELGVEFAPDVELALLMLASEHKAA